LQYLRNKKPILTIFGTVMRIAPPNTVSQKKILQIQQLKITAAAILKNRKKTQYLRNGTTVYNKICTVMGLDLQTASAIKIKISRIRQSAGVILKETIQEK